MIEHLTKEEGLKLLDMMEAIAKKKMIVFTPNGFSAQECYFDNPWQAHKSGWSVKEMKNRGYRVIGIHGWMHLRGERSEIKFRPTKFWMMISELTQIFIRNYPELAFQILCIKTND